MIFVDKKDKVYTMSVQSLDGLGCIYTHAYLYLYIWVRVRMIYTRGFLQVIRKDRFSQDHKKRISGRDPRFLYAYRWTEEHE